MRPSIVRRLNRVNREFYRGFAVEFSRSRAVLQPGIARAISLLGPFESLLDLGCGDGRVGRALVGGRIGGDLARWNGRYLGVDFTESLLDAGEPAADPSLRLAYADLSRAGWSRALGIEEDVFDAAVLFSFLHHIPSHALRLGILAEARSLLRPGGSCAISVWHFLHRDRFRRKIVDWSAAGLREEDVEEGDLLIDWRRGGRGIRYVHHFDRDELAALCEAGGLQVTESYFSDGETDDLGLYILARRP